jgi:hypothetical protein
MKVETKLELKEFVNDSGFIEKMNSAFSDLRADYELSMDIEKEKINELKQIHVDNRNYLADLQSYSKKSSGVISGLRGTGKTHLFLLARENINQNIHQDKSLCIYLNVKRLYVPNNINQELFNRIFSIFIYNEISKQLASILEEVEDSTILNKFLSLFNNDKRRFVENLNKAILKLASFKSIAYEGNEHFEDLDKGDITKEEYNKELIRIQAKISAKLGVEGSGVNSELTSEMLSEVSDGVSRNNTYIKFLNINSVRQQLIDLLKMLNIDSLTIFVDEWEKLYYKPSAQEYLSFYIDRIIDTPLYFWLGVVPYRGELYHLDNGADLQHYINLDESLVYENSKYDRDLCMAYFKEFINKRLYYYFKDEKFNYNLLFNDDRRLEMLVLASMGNSRDFGTMLLNCWSEYKAYRTNKLTPGRPFQYINHNMIIKSIKNNGDKKLSNIKDNANLLTVWREIEKYCIEKRSSHFAIEETKENMECLGFKEYSELIYHRLLHFRKGHVPPKDTKIENKLSIYALNYASIYDLHAKDRKINFITEYDVIHDRVRRYIYNPKKIINEIKIKDGEVFPCSSCGLDINIHKMVGAWQTNSCPYCAGKIRNE